LSQEMSHGHPQFSPRFVAVRFKFYYNIRQSLITSFVDLVSLVSLFLMCLTFVIGANCAGRLRGTFFQMGVT
jgi:hypothetical protein